MSSSAIPPGMDLSKIPVGPPPPGVTPNFIDPVTLSGVVVAVGTTSSVLAFILLCTRLFSTTIVTRTIGSDDYTVITGFVFSLAYTSIMIWNRGFARHDWDLPLSEYSASFSESIFVGIIVAALALLFAKISILILFLRLFSTNRVFRYLICSALLLTIIIHTISILVDCIMCVPRSGETFGSQVLAARCIKTDTWSTVQGAFEVFLDLWIFILPLPIIWKLQMSDKRKVGVSIIFMTALIACAASILGLYYRIQFKNSDALWNSFVVIICTMVDINVAITVACMPACASFGHHIVSNARSRMSNSRSQLKTPTSSAEEGGMSNGGSGKYWRIRNPFVRGDSHSRMFGSMEESTFQTDEFDLEQNKARGSPYRG